MEKADYEAVKNHNDVSNREFVCGLVEVTSNRVTLNVNSEFFTISESRVTGIIPLDSGDEASSIDKMKAAADYFAELSQDLRQATQLYQSREPETVTPSTVASNPRNQHQQTEHLEKIHFILEQLPEEERAIYQKLGFGDRARMYKIIDDEKDPVKMEALICSAIRAISEN
jgi:hypothetical protein